MNTTTLPSPVMEVLGSITFYAIKIRPLLPTYLHLIVSSLFPIYAAAHASLRRPASAAPVKKKKRSEQDGQDRENERDESSSPIETLTASDAILFPVLAGVTLTGLYLVIKWLEDPKLLNQILGYYFSWIGIFFCFKFIKDVLHFARSWIFPVQFSWGRVLYKFDEINNCFIAAETGDSKKSTGAQNSINKFQTKLPSWVGKAYMQIRRTMLQEMTCTITVRKPFDPLRLSLPTGWLDVLAGIGALFVAFHSTLGIKTPWYLTNLQGFAFCYGSLQFMSPGTSAVGSLLLALLFFYDIYMVFYTPMMITVATKLDVPIKLLFPKKVSGVSAMAMLGLGDIVVPGIMIAFALRFDLYRHYALLGKKEKNKEHLEADDKKEKQKEIRPTYVSARGLWAERAYTTKNLWSPILQAKEFPKPYFKATMAGYIMGMVSTVTIMTVFDHGQPALLYLVPGVLLSFWGTALVKGEVKLAWQFDEGEEAKEKEKKEDEKRKAEEEEKKDEKVEKKPREQKKSVEEKEVEAGLKPFLSFNIYLPRKPASAPSGDTGSPDSDDDSGKTPPKESPSQGELNKDEAPAVAETKLEDAETESETSTGASSTSSADIVSQEEAFEAEDAVAEDTGNDIVSTRDDEGGAHGVKRRRRG